MFMTFSAQEDQDGRSKTTSGQGTQAGTRPRRSQVARACDWCRLNRIKCDNNQPCRHCEARGGECSSNGRGELRSLPQATREIEKLKAQIKSLETQLKDKRESREPLSPPPSRGGSTPTGAGELQETKRSEAPKWEGAWTNSQSSSHIELHGPSSSFYYIHRLSSFLGAELNQQHEGCRDAVEQPSSASKVFANPTADVLDCRDPSNIPSEGSLSAEFLSRSQEDYFLSLFWESYFSNLPILDESEFRAHYESLWVDTQFGQRRKPSAIVDIVMALCMQYGMTFIPRSGSDPEARAKVDSNDSSVAGRGFFRRCQTMLAYEMERPSLNTLQCHILSALYLRNASFSNMEHTTIAVAVRLAYLLGLHREPPSHLPQKEQELRKRLYWCIYTVENKIGMTLGRPILVSPSLQSCGLPATDAETASEAWGNSVTSVEGITFLHYQVEYAKLITAVRSIDTSFGGKCDSVLAANGRRDPYSDPQCFEGLAKFLSSHLQPLRDWVEQCPAGLKTPRRGSGRSFSTDRSPLEIDHVAPLWLQRHRILLELLYHDQTMSLYRPFLRFSQAPSSSTTLADRMALYCLHHAMAATNIIYQVLTETDILNGWHEAYKYTWNAATSILGFIFGYPVNPSTQSARRALSTVTEIFDIFGNNFAVAASAAIVTRDLANKAEILTDRFRPNHTPSPKNSGNTPSPVSSHRKLGSISSAGSLPPISTAPVSNGLSIAPLLTPTFSPITLPMSNPEDPDGSMDTSMDIDMGYPFSMDQGPLSGGGFGFQFHNDPFSVFDTSGSSIGELWAEPIGADADFGVRSLS